MNRKASSNNLWIMASFIGIVLLTACTNPQTIPPVNTVNLFAAPPTVSAIYSIPTATMELVSATFIPTATREPVRATIKPTATIEPLRTVTYYKEQNITWMECQVPDWKYYSGWPDSWFAYKCLDLNPPKSDLIDLKTRGEKLPAPNSMSNWRLSIGQEVYETKSSPSTIPGKVFDYELLKNGVVFARASSYFSTYDPNRELIDFGGKPVWVVADPYAPIIIWDGVNLNEKYQLEGAYYPYMMNNKPIFLGKKGGKYQIVYDEQKFGVEFDRVSIAYCCGSVSITRGQEQYWLWGERQGKQYIVALIAGK